MRQNSKKSNILRILSVVTVAIVLLTFCTFPTYALAGGPCGEDLTWTFNAGTLTISGKGEMQNYKDGEMPAWYVFRDDIVRINIADTVTSIGDFAFYGCKSLISVQIPDSVKTIGKYAFTSCENLTSVQFGKGLTSIGESAFYNCYALASLHLPYGLTAIGSQAFYRCESLYTVTIPADVKNMGTSVFAYCKNLVRAEVNARLTSLPSWTFYGCEMLTTVSFPQTVNKIENSAFKQCESLSSIYYKGDEKQTDAIEDDVLKDVPVFEYGGYISSGDISQSSMSGQYIEHSNDTATQIDTTVLQDDSITLVYKISRTYQREDYKNLSCIADISLTVMQNKAWDYAIEKLNYTLNHITDVYAAQAASRKTTVTLFMYNDAVISNKFLDFLSGRDIKLVLNASNGSSWKIDCNTLNIKSTDAAVPPVKDYSHTVTEGSKTSQNKLGTDKCYNLTFSDTVEKNAEVVIQLPPKTAANSNAYLYQVESDGSYTKLQAVRVDEKGKAHFYVGSVKKDTEYVIGLNVPGESTEDVIVTDEENDQIYRYGSPLMRLEDLSYVNMGRTSSWGMTGIDVMWILIGVILGLTVIIGGVMFVWNKKKNQPAVKAKKK